MHMERVVNGGGGSGGGGTGCRAVGEALENNSCSATHIYSGKVVVVSGPDFIDSPLYEWVCVCLCEMFYCVYIYRFKVNWKPNFYAEKDSIPHIIYTYSVDKESFFM